MSATMSMRLRHLLLQSVFHRTVASVPTTAHVCLTWDVAPLNATGVMLGEPKTGGYARQPINLDAASWLLSGFGEVANADPVFFPTPTADWGYLQGWALTDSAAIGTGYTLASGSLVTPVYVRANHQQAIAPQAIILGIYD